MEHYTLKGYADLPISLSYYPAQANAPIAIYAHGINGFKDWGGMPQIAETFVAAGISFVSFNFSHNGTTPDAPDDFVNLDAYAQDSYLKRQYDLGQVLSHCQSTYFSKPARPKLFLIGHSRGGVDVLLFAARNNGIAKLVTWAAPAEAKTPWGNWSSDELKKWQEEGLVYRLNSRTNQELPIHYSLYQEYKANKAQLSVEQAARKLKDTPWLIIHGEADEAVFVKAAYHLKEWQAQAEVYIIPNTGHTFNRSHPWPAGKSLPEASLKLISKTLDFLLKD